MHVGCEIDKFRVNAPVVCSKLGKTCIWYVPETHTCYILEGLLFVTYVPKQHKKKRIMLLRAFSRPLYIGTGHMRSTAGEPRVSLTFSEEKKSQKNRHPIIRIWNRSDPYECRNGGSEPSPSSQTLESTEKDQTEPNRKI